MLNVKTTHTINITYFTSLHEAYERKWTLVLKKGDYCNQIFVYSPVTNKLVLKFYYPSKPRLGLPGMKSKIAQFRN